MEADGSVWAPIVGAVMVAALVFGLWLGGWLLGHRLEVGDWLERCRWWLASFDPVSWDQLGMRPGSTRRVVPPMVLEVDPWPMLRFPPPSDEQLEVMRRNVKAQLDKGGHVLVLNTSPILRHVERFDALEDLTGPARPLWERLHLESYLEAPSFDPKGGQS